MQELNLHSQSNVINKTTYNDIIDVVVTPDNSDIRSRKNGKQIGRVQLKTLQ